MNKIESFKNHYFDLKSSALPTTAESRRLLKLFQQKLAVIEPTSKHRLMKKIDALNTQIEKIEKALKASQQKIGHLEGGEAAKIFLIGTLIKLFSQWYHAQHLKKKHQQVKKLQDSKVKYETKIATLHKALAAPKPTEPEKTAIIFEIEHLIRVAIEKNFPGKEIYQKLYEETVLPLVKEAKASITNQPLHFAVQAAAAKGQAAQAGLQALQRLTETKSVIENSKVSKQQVFLLPEQKAVFKISDERAKEEQEIIDALFDLMSKRAVVGTFDIQKTSISTFGMQVSEEVTTRGFTLDALSPSMRIAIKKELSNEDRLVFEKYEKAPQKTDPAFDNYQKIKQHNWFVKLPGQEWQQMSLQALQNLHLANKLPAEALVGLSQRTAKTLEKHIQLETTFFQALNYFPTLHANSQTLYVSPDLSDPQAKTSYQLCEKFRWTYTDDKGNQIEIDFKTVHANLLENKSMNQLEPVKNQEAKLPTKKDVATALGVQWKTIAPELMQLNAGTLTELRNIQAKPFMSEMILMKDLNINLGTAILERLTPDAEFNAILTGEMQLLDLHSGNLGLAPEPNDEYERFKNLKFTIIPDGRTKKFKELLSDYLEGKIESYMRLIFKEDGKTINKAFKDLPELQKALNVNWQLVIFDTDLSLAEDNRLQLQIRTGVEEHLIPLRSVFLETDWKDKPLDKKTIERLIDSDERDLRVKNWISREDAPIYKQLSPSIKKQVKQQIAPLIENITLSEPRKNNPGVDTTLKSLKKQFVQEISNTAQAENLVIWKDLEKDLSINLKTPYDLTSNSPDAIQKRQRIAAQLFPRITYRQQTALLERQQCRKEYLSSYQQLAQSSLTDSQLATQIEQFIKNPTTLLTSIRKEEFLNQISTTKNLLDLKQKICDECQPTYFNLMKAMYPLLADAYALNMALYANSEEAGKYIGLYNMPLEPIIAYAQENFADESPEARLATNLQNQINSIYDPAFFGHWT